MATLAEYNYYEEQLNQIDPLLNPDESVRIKLSHSSGETKWISLNDASSEVLLKFLKDHYNV